MIGYVYGLYDPRDGAIRYVGWSLNPKKRLTEHCWQARTYARKPAELWIKGTLSRGGPVMRVLEAAPVADRVTRELHWIWTLVAAGAELTNRHAHLRCPIGCDGRVLCGCRQNWERAA